MTPVTLTLKSMDPDPEEITLVYCSVCKMQQDFRRCFGNSYGLICRDCLATAGDIDD